MLEQWLIGAPLMATHVLSVIAFGYMGCTLRNTWSRALAWLCFGIYSLVTLVAVDLLIL